MFFYADYIVLAFLFSEFIIFDERVKTPVCQIFLEILQYLVYKWLSISYILWQNCPIIREEAFYPVIYNIFVIFFVLFLLFVHYLLISFVFFIFSHVSYCLIWQFVYFYNCISTGYFCDSFSVILILWQTLQNCCYKFITNITLNSKII
jgi:hypothetical protein